MSVDLIDQHPEWRTCGDDITIAAAGGAAFVARRRDRARLVVENGVEIGRLDKEGGRDRDVVG